MFLWDFVKREELGEVFDAPIDVYLSEYDVVQPDIVFISKGGLGIIESNRILGGPDLVVEILSRFSLKLDRQIKKKLYARHGVSEYWIVDPTAKKIDVYGNQEGQLSLKDTFLRPAQIRSSMFAGFHLDLAEVFLD